MSKGLDLYRARTLALRLPHQCCFGEPVSKEAAGGSLNTLWSVLASGPKQSLVKSLSEHQQTTE